jgi:hypothetical protein
MQEFSRGIVAGGQDSRVQVATLDLTTTVPLILVLPYGL